jgi:hypothetical protein
MPFRPADPVNAVKASPDEMTGPRAFGSVTLPLGDMQRVSRLLNVTINTLAVSCLAGGLRRHLLAHGGGAAAAPAPRRWWWSLKGPRSGEAAVPNSLLLCSMVDTRAMKRSAAAAGPAAPAAAGCNSFSFIGVPVPTGPAPPLARLAAAGAALDWIRGGVAVALAVMLPPAVQFFERDSFRAAKKITGLLPAKATMAFSNMRGPVKRVALQGYLVERMYNGEGAGYG